MFPNRLKIDTPELYQNFVSGLIGSGYQAIFILPGSHPNIMSLPKLFSGNTSYDSFRFEDEYDNVVTVDTIGVVKAKLKNGKNLTLGLPNDYEQYHISIFNTTLLSTHDYDYIIQWKNVVYLELLDNTNDIAYDLFERVAELKYWKKLLTFKVKLQVTSYQKLEVATFLKQIPSILLLDFEIKGTLSSPQATQFKTKHAGNVGRYGIYIYMDLGWIMFMKAN